MALRSVNEACRGLEGKLYDLAEDELAVRVPAILKEACVLVRRADPADPLFPDVVNRVSQTVNVGISVAYDSTEVAYLASFAHTRQFPLLQGPNTLFHLFTPQIHETLLRAINVLFDRWKTHPLFIVALWIFNSIFALGLPKPWNKTPRPSPSSSRLSRFLRHPVSSPPGAFQNVSQARCEISSDKAFSEPLRLVNNGSCIVLPSMGGYKQRTPFLTYYILDDTHQKPFPLTVRHADVGLSDIAYAATTDEQRKLIFVADSYRIKSYAWRDRITGKIHKKGLPMHTLASRKHSGPLAVVTSGTLLRGGEGSAAVWKLDGLPTHGRGENTRIGGRFKQDTWRDDYDEIEDSAGGKHTSVIKFADSSVSPAVWHPHPGLPGIMLCSSDPSESRDWSFISLDLEHGGKTVVRYFGNGGGICDFSTSAADPTVFATGASDGHARLHDTRMPLPVLSFCAGSGQENCGGIALVHPDGVPVLFTGSTNDEVIRLWDIRARKMIYELSIGNNSVNGMTWNDAQNALYVSTTCSFMDRNGYTSGYRRARLPSSMHPTPAPPGGISNHDDDGEFDKLFDAGHHRLFRYAFKSNPDPSYLNTGAPPSENLHITDSFLRTALPL
ncbi:hypothetical protein C8F04DRAFT_1154867 [Mycena alexandri]|uniref:Uncharacterized protein n=1 Tax=Mycena alexandri TaxID=1745969 RepID=A0AAD6RZ91_9AGAR|nr:hypothetical protein C8F04DRAFT_1154867 [Mycena alexandri]